MTAGMAAASCMKKAWPPSYSASWAPGIASGQELAVGRRGDPVEAPAADEGWACNGVQAAGCVVLGPGGELVGEAGTWAPVLPFEAHPLPDQRDHVGVGLPPGLVPAGVEELHPLRRPLLGAQLDELVKRVGSPSRPAGGGAGECEPSHPLRVPDGQLLGHHSPERDPEDQAVLPAHGIEQPGGVVGEVRHGVGPGRHAALAQAALVVGEDLEGLDEGAVGQAGLMPQVAPGARDAQESVPGTLELVVQRDIVGHAPGHGCTVPTGRRPGRSGARAVHERRTDQNWGRVPPLTRRRAVGAGRDGASTVARGARSWPGPSGR